jgi:acyl-CoA synthetase (AMP-forming)/AMP-acid ligase II
VLAEHPAVAEVAVIGVPDETWGEVVRAVVGLKQGTTATEQGIIDFCRSRLAHFKCPKTVEIVETLPRNPTGKILKTELRSPHWSGRERQVV